MAGHATKGQRGVRLLRKTRSVQREVDQRDSHWPGGEQPDVFMGGAEPTQRRPDEEV